MKGDFIMALIKCPECGHDISDKAERCIHCGSPITNSVENNNQFISLQIQTGEESNQLNNLHATEERIEFTCPNCGAQFKPGSKFCAKCGTPKHLNSQCQNQNSTSFAYQNSVASSPYVQNTYASAKSTPKPRFTALGIISILFAVIGFFILPIIFNVIGLILGIITFASNPKEEKEATKPIWKYKNKARGIGMTGLLLNIVGIVFMIFNMIFGVMTFSNIF